MSILGSFEKNFLFNFTRVLTHILIGLLVLSIIGGIIYLFKFEFPNSKVVYEDVISSLQSPYRATENNSEEDDEERNEPTEKEKAEYRKSFFAQYKVTESIQKYFSTDENFSVLENWLSTLNENEKQDFLENLHQIIIKAEESNPNTIQDVINEFKVLKSQKISDYHDREALMLTQKGVIIMSLIGSAGLIALFTLILVLLAVERNTRPQQLSRPTHEEVHNV